MGNIVGSNIFNILAILGLASMLSPIDMGGIKMVDLVVMILLAILALPMAKTGFSLTRREGMFLLAAYGAYMLYLMPKKG